jgi:hypothetical protein
MERTTPPENLDLPKPWENQQTTRAQWQKNRAYLMSFASGGWRPDGWWLFDKGLEPPKPQHRQTRILYEMGELKGAELEKALEWFRAYYDDAHDTDDDRTAYWRWEDIPSSLIAKWDAEKEIKK